MDGKGSWWCATKVDSNGNMKPHKWARCNEYCATDDSKSEDFLHLLRRAEAKRTKKYSTGKL